MPVSHIPIDELESAMNLDSVYQMINFQVRSKKDGGQYVSMLLRDATGRIPAMLWDNFDGFLNGKYADNDFLEVGGSVQTYNGQLQLRATRVRKISESELDLTKFLPASVRSMVEMRSELKQFIDSIEDTDYRAVVASVFGNGEFIRRFELAAAGAMMHHAYLHGLLEHTLSVARTALDIAKNYPMVNRSLLLAAALLHDCGKVMEYSCEGKIAITDAGRLLGHISVGNALIEAHCAKIAEFPADKKVYLQHCILSHHGEYEYGSPKRPKLPEALVLHSADLIDSQLGALVDARKAGAKGSNKWEQLFMFGRYMYLRPDMPLDGAGIMGLLGPDGYGE